jgi:hypothetical protein
METKQRPSRDSLAGAIVIVGVVLCLGVMVWALLAVANLPH